MAGYLDATVLSAMLGVVLLLVAWQVARSRERTPRVVTSGTFTSSYVEPTTGVTMEYQAERMGVGLAVSLLAGSMSGLLGIGGGIINVPTMSTIMGVPFRVAVTTSTYMLGATAAASCSAYLARGQLDPYVAAPVAIGIIAGAQVGSRIGPRVSASGLRRLFAGLCIVFAIQMLGARAVTTERRPSQVATAVVLRLGAGVAGAGFIIGLALTLADRGAARDSVTLSAIPAGLVVLDPSSWLTASAIVLIGTPAIALITTAIEFARVDRRVVAVCGVVFLILGGSVLLASRI